MGTWSDRPFGNDTALDWLADLARRADGPEWIADTLQSAMQPSGGDADREAAALAAAAIVAAASMDEVSGIRREARAWIKRTGFAPTTELQRLALHVLDRIATDSALRDLWAESGGLAGWVRAVAEVQSVLARCLDAPAPQRSPKKTGAPRSLTKLIDLFLETRDPGIGRKVVDRLSRVEDPNAQGAATGHDLPLNLAAKAGFAEAIAALIDRGADLDARSRYGYRALTLACAHDHVDAARALLDGGAALLERHPVYDGDGKVVGERDVCVALLVAAGRGGVELLGLLLGRGAAIDETDLNGETLLHKAAEADNLAVIDYLIASGVDVDRRKCAIDGGAASRGETPLHYAVRAGRLLAARRLVEGGADVNALEYFIGRVDTWFNTPLDLVSPDRDADLYRFLISKGAVSSGDLDEPGLLLKLVRGGGVHLNNEDERC